MKYRRLGYTDLQLSEVGIGTWIIGGARWEWGWGVTDDEESIRTIHAAFDQGVNWIDTAACYGLGHAEEVVARTIKDRRSKVIIATKCGRGWNEETGEVFGRLKSWSIRKECEDSLRRLQTDVIDLWQIHWPDPEPDIEEAWGEMTRLVQEGKVRYLGVSNFSVAQLKRLQSIHPVASNQPPYSMLRRDIEAELLPYCAANKIGVVVYSPIESGMLAGKFNKDYLNTLPANDWRRTKSSLFQEPEFSINVEFVDKLRPIADRKGCNLSQLAIAWVLRRSEVTAAIAGARRAEQIKETTIIPRLTPDEIKEIDGYLLERDSKLKQ
ncbi:aldo/keto reductase [Leptolinea tardivitalis]|uniref:Aldo/keto reductase n=1 Tax=Leptolinea tardivitalis TaxID=229920 RepID=A0A0P6XJG3_9CHLR|nr:aldo/keto reductase [Leptolinea tardivitalis]KPL75136.1 aldo/keto reductase [Leptolinea tardivitalis]GAP20380.1 predicted oxidoreductase [Leptolinea tardivitalis]